MPYLLIGLGNPGAKFTNTRHNLGVQVLRQWAHAQQPTSAKISHWQKHPRAAAEIATLKLANQIIITCAFPLTFMNQAGTAIRPLLKGKWWSLKKPYSLDQILIIHDDLDLPLCIAQLKSGGSARGHNGVRSIHDALHTTNVPRLLIGIGRPRNQSVNDYVLQEFSADESKKINDSLPAIFKLINNFLDY